MKLERLIAAASLLLLFATEVSAATEPSLQCKELVNEVLRHDTEVLAAQRRFEDACQRQIQRTVAGQAADDSCSLNNLAVTHTGDKETDEAVKELWAAELRATSRTKQACYRLQQAYTEQELIRSQVDQLRDLLRIAEANYSAGKVLQQDVLRAQLEISLMETRSIETERNLLAIEAEINTLLEKKPLSSPVPRPSEEELHAIKFSIGELEAKAKEAPPVLPCKSNRQAENEQETDSPDGMSRCRRDTNFVLLQLNDEYLAAQNAAKLVNMYEKTVLPQSRFAAHSSLVAYEEGTAVFSTVLMNYATMFEAALNCSKQSERLSLALVRLEALTGMQLIE